MECLQKNRGRGAGKGAESEPKSKTNLRKNETRIFDAKSEPKGKMEPRWHPAGSTFGGLGDLSGRLGRQKSPREAKGRERKGRQGKGEEKGWGKVV